MFSATRAWLLSGDRWVPALFVLFFVGLALVEARLIHIAVSTSTGLVTETPAARPVVGWDLRMEITPRAAQSVPVSVRVVDRDGQRVRDVRVRIVAERVSRYAQLVTVRLVETDGVHRGMIRLPIGGAWKITAIAERDGGRAASSQAFDVPAGTEP
jgi:hypothetical protein